MVCWHVGMGMGLYGVKAAAARLRRTASASRASSTATTSTSPTCMQRVHWDPEFARRAGQPDHLRLRPHARDLAHPPLHRLDGRRRLALEARLRVPPVQLRRRHALAARHGSTRKYLADGDRPAVDLDLWGENQRGEVTTPGPRHDPAAEPRARAGAAARPARRRDATCRARSTRSPRSSRRGDEPYPVGRRPRRRARRRRAAPHARPARQAQRARRRDDAAASIDALDAAGDRRGGARRSCSPAPATTSAAASDIVGAQRRRRRRRAPRVGSIQRRLPTQAHRLIPLRARRPGAGGVRGAGLGRRHRAPPRARRRLHRSRPTTPGSGSRSPTRGFTPDSGATWLLPRRVGEVRAARAAAARPRARRAPRPRPGALIHRAVPADELDGDGRRRSSRSSRPGPTVALGLTKWLLHAGASTPLDAAPRATRRSRWSCRRAPTTSARARRVPREAAARLHRAADDGRRRREREGLHPRADRHHRAQPQPLHAPHDRELVPGRPATSATSSASACGPRSARPGAGPRS